MSVQDVSLNLSHKFPYKWNLADGYPAKGIKYHGTTVMTTFACGGGSTMGVPQKRERVFFIAHKTDKILKLNFSETPIKFKDIYYPNFTDRKLQPKELQLWNNKRPGERNLVNANIRLFGKDGYFRSGILRDNQTPPTVIAGDALVLDKEPRHLNKIEISLIGSFPQDYNYTNVRQEYLIGMSVPPVMMAQVAHQVYEQLIEVTQ